MKEFKTGLEQELSRLHPVSMIYFIVKGLKELSGLLPLIPVAVLIAPKVLGENVSRTSVTAALIGITLLIFTAAAWICWKRLGYRIDDDAIYIEHGVWVKNNLWITKDRIQSLDTKITMYDRVFGLVRLQMATAGGQKSEVVLSSISMEEAERIRTVLGFAGESAPPVVDAVSSAEIAPVVTQSQRSGEVMRKLSFIDLLINSTSSDRFGIVLVLSISGLGKIWDNWLKNTNIWQHISGWLGPAWIYWSIGLLVVFSWILAVGVTFFIDYGFQVRLQGDKLLITKGLLEKKQITILPGRIQAVHLINHALRRPFGYVSIQIIIAGNKEGDEKSTVIFPLIRSTEVDGFLQQFIPSFSYEEKWATLEHTAWRSYVLYPVLLSTIVAIPLILWIPGGFGWLALLLPLIAFMWGQLTLKQVGWSFQDGQLAFRYGLLSQHRVLVPKRRIQWYQMSQSPFQKNRKVATMRIALASGKEGKKFSLRHAPESQVEALLQSISYKN